MEAALAPLAEIFALDTDLLLNSITGVSEAHAAERVLPGTNSLAFLVAHAIDARHFVAALLGRPGANPLGERLRDATGIDDVVALPPLADLRELWLEASRHLEVALEAASAEGLRAGSEQKFPVADRTLLGTVAFLAHHESYHVGQLALLRKALGYPAMQYTRPSPNR
jgi:uncharacterized damage-inducible protein DinB